MSEATMDAVSNSARDAHERRTSILYVGAASALAFGIFGPILYYMVRHWGSVDDYSHGFLVAPLALYFAWERRHDLQRATIQCGINGGHLTCNRSPGIGCRRQPGADSD